MGLRERWLLLGKFPIHLPDGRVSTQLAHQHFAVPDFQEKSVKLKTTSQELLITLTYLHRYTYVYKYNNTYIYTYIHTHIYNYIQKLTIKPKSCC